MAEHRLLCWERFIAFGAVAVGAEGDAFFVAFPSAGGALAAARDAQAALARGPIRVRMGLHTGEPLVASGAYVGMDVHRAARIAAAAHGGQIVLSLSTRVLVGEAFPLVDLGEHRFKDLAAPERVFQFGEEEFPPLKSLYRSNLPVPATPFLGRATELAAVTLLLSDPRLQLLTLTGPGGTGKTRLALQAAAEASEAFPDGLFWVSLSPLRDPALVLSEIARALGVEEQPGQAFAGTLHERLHRKQTLLLLDNIEQLLPAAARTIAGLREAEGLVLLLTSRERLRVAGERAWPVPPLSERDGVELFLARATETGGDLDGSAAVSELCRRLDDLPLALELAAARTAVFSPEQLVMRLGQRLDLLKGGSDADARQHTLRATIDWSYDLLSQAEQHLFRRLSAFPGGCRYDTAEQACGADPDTLQSLLDKSLLRRRDDASGEPRYWMLETIREYALERLERSDETEALKQRHATFFSALAEQAYQHRFDDEAQWGQRLAIDHENLRAACDWLAVADPERALGLVGALGWFWVTHGHLAEGRQRMADALARSAATGASRARALTAAGALTARCGDVDSGRALFTDAIGLWRDLGDRGELAAALDGLGWLLVYEAGDAPGALSVFEQSVELRREQGDRPGETRALVGVCQALVAVGDVERAESLSRGLLEAAGGDPRTTHFGYTFLGDCALIRGDMGEAESRYRKALRAALPLGDVIETSASVQGVAMALAGGGDAHRALRLLASVEALFESLGLWTSTPFWDELIDKHTSAARQALGADADAIWAEGRAMRLDDAVGLALAPRDRQ